MDPATLVQALGLYAGTFLVCVVSGLIPLVNTELFLIGAVALVPDARFVFLVLAATLGQMTAKSLMYWASRGAFKMSLSRYEGKVALWRDRFARREPGLSLFMFWSASVGLPPFFVTSILGGGLRVPFARFFLAGTLGRFVRFAVVAAFPKLLGYLA